jgi:hypothetical protein
MQSRRRHYVNTKGMAKSPELLGFSPSFKALWRQYVCAAAWTGRAFEITPQEFDALVKAPCHYCGSPPANLTKWKVRGVFAYNGIDRVDNAAGYVAGNLVPCCKFCNSMKSRLTPAEFISHARRVVAFQT